MFSSHSGCCSNNEQVVLNKWLKVCDFEVQQELFPPLQKPTCSLANVSESDIKEFLTSTPDDCKSSLEDISHSSVSFDSNYENQSFCYNDNPEFEGEASSDSKSEYDRNSSSKHSVETNYTNFSSVSFEREHTPISEYTLCEMHSGSEIDPSVTSNHIQESTRHLSETRARKSFPVKYKKRRKRFKPEQQKLLNTIFSKNQYFSSNKSDLARLAGSFGVPQKTVRVWFQNKRTYWKKKNLNLEVWKSSLLNEKYRRKRRKD